MLADAGVPSARHGSFTEVGPAVEFLKSLPGPFVVKTDGLAAGKGVLVTGSLDEAAEDVRAKLSGEAFGDAGRTVVIEEGLGGRTTVWDDPIEGYKNGQTYLIPCLASHAPLDLVDGAARALTK